MLKPVGMAVLSTLLVSACSTTSLTSYRDGNGPIAVVGEDDLAFGGAVYHVPMLQFNISVTRSLAQCTRDAEEAGGKPVSEIKFDYKVKAEPTYIPGERFVLDYESISNWSKTGDVQLDTFDNGVLKSLTSTISDDTAAIVANLVSTGVGVAKLATGVPSLSGTATSPLNADQGWVCSAEAVQLLANLEKASKTVKEREEELEGMSKKYDHLNRLLKLEIISDAQKAEMAELLSKQESAENRLKAAQGIGEAALALLSVTDQSIWPRNSLDINANGRAVGSINSSPANLKKMMGFFTSATNNPTIDGPWRSEAEVIASLTVRVALQSVTPMTVASCKTKSECNAGSKKLFRDRAGLFYRSPAPAQLILCQTDSESDCTAEAAKGKLLGQPVMAPQFGALRFLPLVNGNFQNNTLNASFRADGTLAAVTYKELASRGKALSGTLASAVESGVKFRDDLEAHKDKKRKEKQAAADAKLQDELDALDHQIAIRKKQDELEKLNTTDPTEGNQAASALHLSYAALAEAERKRLEAEKALAESRKPTEPAAPAEPAPAADGT